jgi:hypothetical protein
LISCSLSLGAGVSDSAPPREPKNLPTHFPSSQLEHTHPPLENKLVTAMPFSEHEKLIWGVSSSHLEQHG